MQITTAGGVTILSMLLSKADFFVDGKDLQTFVARLPCPAFFCPFRSLLLSVPRAPSIPLYRGHSCAGNFAHCNGLCLFKWVRFRRRPVLHHVMTRVHGRRQQVLPVVAVPCRIEIQALAFVSGCVRDDERPDPAKQAFEFGRHDSDLLFNVLPTSPCCGGEPSVTRRVNTYDSMVLVTNRVKVSALIGRRIIVRWFS